MNYRYYAKIDYSKEYTPANEIELSEAYGLNSQGYGIFQVNNAIKPKHMRRIEFIDSFQELYIESDSLSKEEQYKLIKSGLKPTYIVESKRSYQCHWHIDNCDIDIWRKISKRLIDFYKADPACKNPVMLMRVPGYYHCKDMNNKYFVKEIYRCDKKYKIKDLEYLYPPSSSECIKNTKYAKEIINTTGDTIFDKIWSMDCKKCLERLSGSSYVNFENYSFLDHGDNTYQIVVNGKSTSCWVDSEGSIGSHDNGGPSIWKWLKWFGYSNKEVFEIIRKEFIELWS